MSLQARLEQAKKDRDAIEANIAEIEKEIEDSEVTYSIGDRFKHSGALEVKKYILVKHGVGKVCLVCLEDGNRWTGPSAADNIHNITPEEFAEIAHNQAEDFARYWDSRKKQRC